MSIHGDDHYQSHAYNDLAILLVYDMYVRADLPGGPACPPGMYNT